ncbi:DUF6055 domain-containing protein [Myxococcus sp. MxC21-1]|uniref:DUF6055 domain-containing protein n=1 Tax=Myxococcus sp. MxC21-1 TaxID=3041439 RepID=UPI00292DC9DC|nr:DUF6055 domain-containing protein [Myxococcus sp. MxC21-1]WNZ64727.1 DUF6055 domain-containing protein [Myxococcus sp. MxC21-1]
MSEESPATKGRRGSPGWAAVLLGLSLLTGCYASQSARVLVGKGAGAGIDVEYQPRDAEAAVQVKLAVERAIPRLQRWGTFDDTVTIVVHPNHAALERAANRPGHDFLRAWARYEQIELQSPRTWTARGASQGQVDELLLHELTHSLMYQVASDRLGWTRKRIPLWFREGMASYTAEQGYRVSSLDDLEHYWRQHPNADPLSQAEALYQSESGVVYGAAHHAFTFLARRYGEDTIRKVLRGMSQGPDFDSAFQRAVGVTQESFLQDFRRYVRLRGFKGARQLQPARPRPASPMPVAPSPAPQ